MRKFLLAFVASAIAFVACNSPSNNPSIEEENKPAVIEGISVPAPLGSINDFENIISQPDETDLQKSIDDLRQTTGNEIVLITLDTIPQGMDANDFASAIGNEWGVGDAEKNNGLVVLLSERQSQVGIATGKGLEVVYNDTVCSNIIGKMIPHLSIGNYADGLQIALAEFSLANKN